mmetsp:Transcript_171173/g.548688  ORF Transcript_171173/g.548688 Transcript_171173/m.548688 type:complete len:259 (-) Transcript_171173:66-842(-)|eukprot:CAMPEP_0203970842 /NCGR_PEP_ID=MMETSP0359-20131031/98172_1 /ASSEMBLY_ACC=CAM_ASM_000338 /TAXON_ID=268821 /ORGANISM="Scrippsiella Hangoei, Strain SHTV-5" /LENGTH=258 /DNA_ID=CAMNT_0050908803 /DNA_START=118 /DNA_END=894 /DNA_ORIENTATION=+
MAACPYGRASICFPLSLPAQAALKAIEASSGLPARAAEVAGYTTCKTRAAGASSVRLQLLRGGGSGEEPPEQGAHLVAVRAAGREGWLLGLAGMRTREEGQPDGMEVVILARPDTKLGALMYLSEETLRELMLEGAAVEVRFCRFLLPVQHDCPEQWLRDRLLRLANLVEEAYPAPPSAPDPPPELVRAVLAAAGLAVGLAVGAAAGDRQTVLPADHGNRVSEEELGYWDEEMRLNTRCAATMDGSARLDYFMSHMPA